MAVFTVEKKDGVAVVTLKEKPDWEGFNDLMENVVPTQWCVAETVVVDMTHLKHISSIEAIIFHRILSQHKRLRVVAKGTALQMMQALGLQGVEIYSSCDEALTA